MHSSLVGQRTHTGRGLENKNENHGLPFISIFNSQEGKKKKERKKKSHRNLKEKLFVASSPFPPQPEGRDDFKRQTSAL